MGYDKDLDERVRAVLSHWDSIESRKMFGGVCHLTHGNMLCGVYKEFLILRLGEDEARKALESPDVRPFDITGRPMKGWVMVDRDGYEDDGDLEDWLDLSRRFVETLPPKQGRTSYGSAGRPERMPSPGQEVKEKEGE